jgi:hypothetical protein
MGVDVDISGQIGVNVRKSSIFTTYITPTHPPSLLLKKRNKSASLDKLQNIEFPL